MKEVDVKQLRMQRGYAAHHEGAGERQKVTELSSSINTHFQNVVVATSDTFIVFHAVACYLSILHIHDKAITTVVVVAQARPHML